MKTVCGTMVDELILRIDGKTVERKVLSVKDISITLRGLRAVFPDAWLFVHE